MPVFERAYGVTRDDPLAKPVYCDTRFDLASLTKLFVATLALRLVADGTLDELDPSANDRSLADSVPGAKLILYPGAGHAFLFQDMASFLPAVQRFLR